MFERSFEKETPIPAPQRRTFDWHTRAGAFERLTPPWDPTQVIEYGGIQDGQRVILKVVAPWPRRWVAQHEDYIDGVQFKDRQIEGPFPRWVHTHRVEPDRLGRPDRCVMRDAIEFKLPMGPLGVIAYRYFMRRQIERMFDHRHATLVADMTDHLEIAGDRKLTVAVTGASGTIGRALSAWLSTGGHTVRGVARRDALTFDYDAVDGADAVVHLAGEPIVQKWDADARSRIRRSRVDRTRLLCEAIGRMPADRRPRVILSGSAVGYYGDRADSILTEDSPNGEGFLAEVARGWEAATRPAEDVGVRVVHLRTGIVLTPRGGALAKMLTPFKLGLGGRLGSGDQHMSWITIDDHVRAMYRCLFDESLSGAVNLVAPDPVTNRRFTRTLASVLQRPAVLPAPRFAMRAVYGEMPDEALLVSQRVEPMRMARAGFRFRQSKL
ncbi:MAG: TIGR01777 family oxidoreductase, partial [Planctomycetota bacterium]